MKKYIRPEIKVRVLENENILAASGLEDGTNGAKIQNISTRPSFEVESTDGVLSKHTSLWDDEEE